MAITARRSVAIIHEHGLLGEGLAQYLSSAAGVDATVASAADPDAVHAALADRPAVVVYESNGPGRQFDLAALCPGAVLIDVSSVFTAEVASTPALVLARVLEALDPGHQRPA